MNLADFLTPLPLVAVLRGISPQEVPDVADALTGAGFRVLEVTLNSPDPFDSIRALTARCGATCLVGAGTVIDPSDVERVREAGGRLIVMPHADVAVIREAKRQGMISGCLSCSLKPFRSRQARLRIPSGSRCMGCKTLFSTGLRRTPGRRQPVRCCRLTTPSGKPMSRAKARNSFPRRGKPCGTCWQISANGWALSLRALRLL